MFTEDEITTTISGKMKMLNVKIEVGEEVYIIISPDDTARGRIGNPSYFKLDNELFA